MNCNLPNAGLKSDFIANLCSKQKGTLKRRLEGGHCTYSEGISFLNIRENVQKHF
jgi:hypothetical protein